MEMGKGGCGMTGKFLTAAVLAALVIAGCRKNDVVERTFSLPGLTAANRETVVSALKNADRGAFYDGIDEKSLKFDLEKKTLSLKYDRMKIAETNIRMAIEAKGVTVEYPKNTSGKAGWIDSH